MSGLTVQEIEAGLRAIGVPPDKARWQALHECGLADPTTDRAPSYPSRAVASVRPASDPVPKPPLAQPAGQRTEDIDRCFRLLTGISPQTDEWHALVIDGEPYSKARPRFGGGGRVYNSAKQQQNTRRLREALVAGMDSPHTKNVAVACLFYRSSTSRIDVDNLLKQVLDAANGVCWVDDYQVTAVVGVVELDRDFPRTILAIGTHASSMRRDLDRSRSCAKCGKGFVAPFIGSTQRFCSVQCASRSRGEDLRVPLECPECGVPFKRLNAHQKYCSDECRLRRLHKRNRKHPAPRCVDCGTQLPGNAKRCRECWRRNAGVQR